MIIQPEKFMEEIAIDELNFDDEFVNYENQDQNDSREESLNKSK